MHTHALLTQYSTKLLTTLNAIESEQNNMLMKTIDRVRSLFDNVVKIIRSQAWTTLGFGLIGGVAAVGSGFLASPLMKTMSEALGRLCPQLGQSLTTWQQGTQTKLRSEADLAKDQSVQHLEKSLQKMQEGRSTAERSISELMSTEAQAYRR